MALRAMLFSRGSQTLLSRCLVSRGALLEMPQTQTQPRWYSDDPKANEAAQEETTQATSEENPPKEEATQECSEESPELQQAKEKAKEMEKKWKMALADQQNYKKIMERDLKNAKEYAIESFAKQMIDVSDNLARGLQNAAKEEQPSPQFTALVDGVKLTHDILHKHLQANGIKEYSPLGEEFDPNLHTALYMRPPQNEEKVNDVVEVVSTGFTFKERVLRSSTVGVAKE
eukprot:CAMPEP_0201522328 /NCGR_PEP_ID=MMETSP0161_2-20130828/16957_1 /ASSEMBLY_ACC=CAM_ASM_000251 /TAXON_ID=180227 /ORGANISM="Neoparamoeba aestuarina, Strain SoJaBio B1-5/56/2" /LENGTH=229 /DNA_ID=CAMNT_0047921143 /DNA_START=44 /DNA_END=733 /DNA_ORIENTATION=+